MGHLYLILRDFREDHCKNKENAFVELQNTFRGGSNILSVWVPLVPF